MGSHRGARNSPCSLSRVCLLMALDGVPKQLHREVLLLQMTSALTQTKAPIIHATALPTVPTLT
jgi:hypothetical protein